MDFCYLNDAIRSVWSIAHPIERVSYNSCVGCWFPGKLLQENSVSAAAIMRMTIIGRQRAHLSNAFCQPVCRMNKVGKVVGHYRHYWSR